jgi:hypothetical protein
VVLKILTVLFALIALRRVIVRYRKGGAPTAEAVFWTLVFAGIGVVVFVPQSTDQVAQLVGVSSGFNLLTFLAIGTLFLFVFRLLTRVHALERDLTRLVRAQALANPQTVAAEPRA